MSPGSQILCADGSIVLEVLSTNPKAGTVHCKCLNNATLGCGSSLQAVHAAWYSMGNRQGRRRLLSGCDSVAVQHGRHLADAKSAEVHIH